MNAPVARKANPSHPRSMRGVATRNAARMNRSTEITMKIITSVSMSRTVPIFDGTE